jgi:hypothetical protein
MRAPALLVVTFLVVGALGAGSTRAAATPIQILAASPTCVAAPLPGLCVGRPASPGEEQAMIAAGKPGIEAELGLGDPDSATCPGTKSFLFSVGNPSRAMVGTDAGTFYGVRFCEIDRPKAGCYVFLYRDIGGWHYVNGRCITMVDEIPSAVAEVYVSGGCANVRDAPSLDGHVVGCLRNGSGVAIDSAPVYAGAHIWWHLTCRGWIAHDFLVKPLGPERYPPLESAPANCPTPAPPYTPMITMSLASGPPGSNLVVIGTGFPPGESVDLYWDVARSFPGPRADAQGSFQMDDGGSGWRNWMPDHGTTQLCGDTLAASPSSNVVKACAQFVIESPATSASGSPVVTAGHSEPGAQAPWLPVASIAAIALAIVLLLISGVMWLLRRSRSSSRRASPLE